MGMVVMFEVGAAGAPRRLSLAVGETASGTPDFVARAARASIEAGETRYPEMAGLPSFRSAVACYLSGAHAAATACGRPFDPSAVVATTGGTHAISVALGVAGATRAAVLTPAWSGFFSVARASGVSLVEVPSREPAGDGGSWRLDLDGLRRAFLDGCGAVIVNAPNNPTGSVPALAELGAALDLARRHGAWLVADEIYHRQIDGHAVAPSFHDVARPGDRIAYVNSLSKNWSMTGWRVGWIEVPADKVADAVAVVDGTTHGVPTFVQRGAVAALATGVAFAAESARGLAASRRVVVDALRHAGRFTFAPPSAGPFAFFRDRDVSSGLAAELSERAGLAVVPGAAFGRHFAPYARLCFSRAPADVAEAASRLAALR